MVVASSASLTSLKHLPTQANPGTQTFPVNGRKLAGLPSGTVSMLLAPSEGEHELSPTVLFLLLCLFVSQVGRYKLMWDVRR